MNHADSRLTALLAQLDISAGTYTTGQISALWVDAGATGVAGALGGQFNMVRISNTTVSVPNSHIYVYGVASYLMDLNTNSGTWADATAHGGTAAGRIKVLHNGTTKYVYLFSD
jgi:hypothetical protein